MLALSIVRPALLAGIREGPLSSFGQRNFCCCGSTDTEEVDNVLCRAETIVLMIAMAGTLRADLIALARGPGVVDRWLGALVVRNHKRECQKTAVTDHNNHQCGEMSVYVSFLFCGHLFEPERYAKYKHRPKANPLLLMDVQYMRCLMTGSQSRHWRSRYSKCLL